MAVVRVISTFHEQSCIDLRTARKFRNQVAKFNQSRISQSNHNDEIAKVESLRVSYIILATWHNYSELKRIGIQNMIDLIEYVDA